MCRHKGTYIESDLMDLLSDIPDISPTTFMDTSDEKVNPFPEANFARMCKEIHMVAVRRGCAQCLDNNKKQDIANLPTETSQTSDFTAYAAPRQRAVDSEPRPMQQAPYLPMAVPFYPNGWNNVGYGSLGHNMQPPPSNNVSAHNGTLLQKNRPVLPEVAGYCPGCTKTYDYIAVETLTKYVAWSEYPEETIRDRNQRPIKGICGCVWSSVFLLQKCWTVTGLPLRDVRRAAQMIRSTCSFLPYATRRFNTNHRQY